MTDTRAGTTENSETPRRQLIILTTGSKLAGPSANRCTATAWSFPSVAMLAPYLAANTTCVLSISQSFDTLVALDDVLAWQMHEHIGSLVFHGAGGAVSTIELQPNGHGATVHILSDDFVGQFSDGAPCSDKQSVRDAFSAMLNDIAKIRVMRGKSYLDYFEEGNRTPEFPDVLCLRDFGLYVPGGCMSLTAIGRFHL